jgi:hypothetical protein
MPTRFIQQTTNAAASHTGSHAGIGVEASTGVLKYNPDGTIRSVYPNILGVAGTPSTAHDFSANANALQHVFTTEVDGSRGQYLRVYFADDAIGGDTFRAFATVDGDATTVRGAHISLNFTEGSTVSGLGAALETTLHMPTGGGMAGTNYSFKAAINADAASSDPAGATLIAFIGITAQGTQAGLDDLDDDVFVFDIQGLTAASGTAHALSSTSLAELPASSIGLRCKVGSGTYYLPLVAVAEWN